MSDKITLDIGSGNEVIHVDVSQMVNAPFAESDVTGLTTKLNNLQSINGVTTSDADLGAFTYDIFTDDSTTKAVLQECETYLKNRLEGFYYTPEMYGAVGNGTTDDTTALNNMFAAARAATSVVGSGSSRFLFKQNATYLITDDIVIGDTGLVTIINGNGAKILTSTANVSMFSWNPNDTNAANGNTSEVEADRYVNRRLYLFNLDFDGNNAAGTIGLKLWATYGSIIEGCQFKELRTGIYSAWALMTSYINIRANSCLDYAFKHESGGANNLWDNANIAFHAGNGAIYQNCRVYNPSGADASWYIHTCSNVILDNCIIEGNPPTYGLHFVDSGTNTRELTIRNMHAEVSPSTALFKIDSSDDLRFLVDNIRCHQPNICLLDGTLSTGIEVLWRFQSYNGNGQFMRCDSANRITFRDSRGADFFSASFYDLVNGETPQISSFSSGTPINYNNFSRLASLQHPHNHIITNNEDVAKNGFYKPDGTALINPTESITTNIPQIAFTAGTGHIDFDYTVPTSNTQITASLWFTAAYRLDQWGNNDPYQHLFYVGHDDSNYQFALSRTRVGLVLANFSGWGTTEREHTWEHADNEMPGRLHHIAIVMNGSNDPKMYWNGVEQTLSRTTASLFVPNRTGLGTSFYRNGYDNNYGDTPIKFSLFRAAKSDAEVLALYNGGVSYDDTSDTHASVCDISATHYFLGSNTSVMFDDDSGNSNDGTMVNFTPPYSPVLNPNTGYYELYGHYNEKTFSISPTASISVLAPYMLPGVPYTLYVTNNGGSGAVTLRQGTVNTYMGESGNYTFPGGASTYALNVGSHDGDILKVTLTNVDGVLMIEEETIYDPVA